MIGADAAIVWATVDGLRVWFCRIFAGLVVVPDLFVVFDIYGEQYFLKAVFFAVLCHPYVVLLEDDLRAQLLVAFVAKTDRMIVVDIITLIFHMMWSASKS